MNYAKFQMMRYNYCLTREWNYTNFRAYSEAFIKVRGK